MKLGYNTNGLACHRWRDALRLIADLGYEAVALTLDHSLLDPYSPRFEAELEQVAALLEELQLASVIETGGRFLLNPRVKHEPTLMSRGAEERARRIEFLTHAIRIATRLNSEAVSFWSGILREPISREAAFERLAAGCREVIEVAAEHRVRLAFEPEPGMFIESFDDYRRLLELVDAPHFGLTIDIGHVQCVETGSIADHLREWRDRLFNVHIEDMCRGVHEHLRFGEGEIDFPPVLRALDEIGYTGCVNVELSRHSHMAPEVAKESIEFLQRIRGELLKSPSG